MNTPITMVDDVLFAAAAIAAGVTSVETASPEVSERLALYGVHPLPLRGGIVSNELIDRLCEADNI